MNTKIDTRKAVALIVTALAAVLALVGMLLWFLPVAKIYGESYTMLEAMKASGQDMTGMLVFIVILYALSVVWAAIPKKWAAVTGMLYGLLPMIIAIAQVSDWRSNKLTLTAGANLMIPVAVCVVVLSLVKLIVLPKKVKAVLQTNPQPPVGME